MVKHFINKTLKISCLGMSMNFECPLMPLRIRNPCLWVIHEDRKHIEAMKD